MNDSLENPAAPRSQRPRGATARPLLSLLAAAACTVLIVLLARAAVGMASGQRLDQLILSGAQDHEGTLAQYAATAVGTVSFPVMAGLLAAAVVLVLLRRRLALLLPLGLLVVGANLTTQILKHLVVSREALGPGIDITPNSFPSGHTTLAAAATIAVVLASGRGRVVLAPLGAVWTAAAGIGTLVLGWHRPSDVIGAIVVVAAWTFLVLFLDSLHTRHRLARATPAPGHGRRRRGGGAESTEGRPRRLRMSPADAVIAVLLGLAGVAGLAYGGLQLSSLQLPLDLEDVAQQQGSFVAMAALIGGGTTAWMALVLVLRTPISHRSRSDDRVP